MSEREDLLKSIAKLEAEAAARRVGWWVTSIGFIAFLWYWFIYLGLPWWAK